MSDTLPDYFAALERLKQRKARINNDTVAVEAGRNKGSIKKSRPQFAQLIAAIDDANREVGASRNEPAERLARAKESTKALQARLDAGLAREVALLKEVFELRKELAALRNSQIIPLREPRMPMPVRQENARMPAASPLDADDAAATPERAMERIKKMDIDPPDSPFSWQR
jgi:hypothetical protein